MFIIACGFFLLGFLFLTGNKCSNKIKLDFMVIKCLYSWQLNENVFEIFGQILRMIFKNLPFCKTLSVCFLLIPFIVFPFHKNVNLQPEFKWRTIPLPFGNRNSQFLMFDSLNGWSLSYDYEHLYRCKDGLWTVVEKPNNLEYKKLYGFSKNNLWIGCLDKTKYRFFLRHFDGDNWENIYTPNTDFIRDLEFVNQNSVWGACEWGEIIHFNGNDWKLVPSPTFSHLNTITMINDSLGWATGEYRGNGFLLKWDGISWKKLYELENIQISRIMMVNPNIGWALGVQHITTVFKFENNELTYVDFTSLIQDTIYLPSNFIEKSIYFFPNRTVHQKGRGAATNFNDGEREVLVSLLDAKKNSLLWFTSDGSIRYIQSDPAQIKMSAGYTFREIGGNSTNECGVVFGDFDNDGDEDIYSVNTNDGNKLRLYGGNVNIKSTFPYNFIEAADRLHILGNNKTKEGEYIYDMGCTSADVDNDGDRDIYISCLYGENQLHENIYGKKFRDFTKQAGLNFGETRSNVGIWGDVNNDGHVDLFVTNEDTTNMLFLNDGAGQFTEITHEAGLASSRSGKGATFGDIDLDGDLDLVVPYFSLRNRIYRNKGTDEKTNLVYFEDVTDDWLPSGSDSSAKSASATLADVDNDGDLDLYFANLVFSNRLYENDGTGKFTDITMESGLLDSSLSHSGCFFDADNSGKLDLYISNRGRNIFYKNIGDGKFNRENKIINLEKIAYSTGFACGDPDKDGDLDCYLCNDNKLSTFYRNVCNNKSFISIKLVGTKSNRDAIGAKTFLYEAGHLNEKEYCRGLREINGGYGYGCQNSIDVHYGVDLSKMYDLKVQFPSGIEIIKQNINPGQFLVIYEEQGFSKLTSRLKKNILRTIKYRKNQYEFILFLLNIVILFSISFLMMKRKWLNKRFIKYLVGIPILFYIFINAFLFDENLLLDEVLPFSVLILSFVVIFFVNWRRVTSVEKERVAEELLKSLTVFDHGSWAVSYLNQLQLFSTNLLSIKKISEKIKEQLTETIAGFYDQVYKEIKRIYMLAKEADIQTHNAAEMERQLLFVSKNLNKIKVNLSMSKLTPDDIWKELYRLIDGIKINIKLISHSTVRLFSCDVISVLKRELDRNEEKYGFRANLNNTTNEKSINAAIQSSEFSAIIDNLFMNAYEAMRDVLEPKIQIELSMTDQCIVLEFKDNGTGIPKSKQEKIFEQNYTTKKNGAGGFGLYFSRTTIEKYGGSISVAKSAKGKGTAFLIRLRLI